MSNFLSSGAVGNTTRDHFKVIREAVQAKWDSLGFLDGLKGHVKENMAQIFENEANHLMTEATVTDSSGSFETVVFPIVRRIFSKLLANDIVSVQALNMPIGKLFFFIPQISDRNIDGSHTSTMGDQLPSCVENNCGLTEWQTKNLYDIFYNDGLFDHSKGKITIQTASGSTINVKALASNGEYQPLTGATALAASNDGTVRNAILAVGGFDGYQGKLDFKGQDGRFRNDGVQMDTESFLASLKVVTNVDIVDPDGNVIIAAGGVVPYRLVTQKYGKGIVTNTAATPCDALGVVYIDLDLSHPVSATGTDTYDGYVGVSGLTAADIDVVVTWAAYESLEMSTDMGEVTFKLDEITVDVEGRKLRATWSPELAMDVNSFHNIDAEAELTAILSEQIAAEIDREILRDLRVAGPWALRWDYLGWRKTALAANAYTQKDWNQTLITTINQISAQIQKATLRGGASYIVVSTEISAILNDLEYFHVSDASAESDQYNMGIAKIGTLQGRYTVYVDPYSPPKSIIIGHKGKSLLDTGYIYAPYVPLQLTPTMYNPANFAPVKGIQTRYAKKLVNNRFFGHVTVDGVREFNPFELR
jgi:hypothetical protein